ncbi:MAG: TetR/AcrR family transcriptional regulator [Acidobacteriota bacterium]
MARPPNADGQRTREAILDAALTLFADNGYFGTSLRDVAGAVGVRESALYNYFASKEALFDTLLTVEATSRNEQLAALVDRTDLDARRTLEHLAIQTLDGYATPRQQRVFRILMSDGIRLARDGRINLIERMSGGRLHLEELMRRLTLGGELRRADPLVLAVEFMGPLVLWRHLQAIGMAVPVVTNRRAFARAHVQQFLQGASRRAATPATSQRAHRSPSRRRRPGSSHPQPKFV